MRHRSKWFLSTVTICILIVPSLSLLGIVSGSTPVSGSINSSITWTKTNSPYTVTGPVNVNSGVTLTIEPGVVVELNGYSLNVDGVLQAVGSSADKIQFSDGQIVFSSSALAFDNQTSSGCGIEEAVLEQTSISSVNAIAVSRDSITYSDDNGVGALSVGGFSMIYNNSIVSTSGKGYGIIVKEGIATIAGNVISGFAMGIWAAGETAIEQNSILNCGCGIGIGEIIGTSSFGSYAFGEVTVGIVENTIANNYIGIGGPIFKGETEVGNVVATGSETIKGNFINNNTYGLALGAHGNIYYNTISNSQIAVTIDDTSGIFSPGISENNLVAYTQDSVHMLGTQDVYADSNWWGTTNIQAINDSIYDRKDNNLLGMLTFTPILTSAVPQAPTQPVTSIPDLPSPALWSPTILPNQTPTETPNSDANNFFQVESNSTITELFFNSTSSELSFKVTGISGTTGYVQYKISKTLLSSPQNVKVLLDGSQLDINISSNDNFWLLYFTYHHSSHNIIIMFSAKADESTENAYAWIVIPAAVAIVVGIIVSVMLKVKTKNKYEKKTTST